MDIGGYSYLLTYSEDTRHLLPTARAMHQGKLSVDFGTWLVAWDLETQKVPLIRVEHNGFCHSCFDYSTTSGASLDRLRIEGWIVAVFLRIVMYEFGLGSASRWRENCTLEHHRSLSSDKECTPSRQGTHPSGSGVLILFKNANLF